MLIGANSKKKLQSTKTTTKKLNNEEKQANKTTHSELRNKNIRANEKQIWKKNVDEQNTTLQHLHMFPR